MVKKRRSWGNNLNTVCDIKILLLIAVSNDMLIKINKTMEISIVWITEKLVKQIISEWFELNKQYF